MDRVLQLHRRLGARPQSDGSTEFCIWSPTATQAHVCLVDGRSIEMKRDPGGYHTVVASRVGAGDRYWIQVDRHPLRPDPASRFQPEGVHGPSQVIDPNFAWTDHDWKGIPRSDWIIYELHLGAWTEDGTLQAAIDRLDELVDLGVTVVELMPLADAPGRWNWGYDGVNLFAPNRNYGTPDDVRQFVDAAHAKGLAVFLDVVYNHFGPEGNYLAQLGPYLSEKHHTVWGAAPNFDDPEFGEGLRAFYLANAIYWLDEYHFDGLRVDAIHCIRDSQRPHIVEDLGRVVRSWSERAERSASLIAETNVHDTQMIQPLDQGGMGFDAQWCDDFLHSVFAVVRPGETLCDRDYLPGEDLSQTLRFGYVYEGSLFQPRCRPALDGRVETSQLIYSIQTHDSVGNHPRGLRFHQLSCRETQRASAALLLLSPAIPMLFMGEEFATEHPFQFFVDFGDAELRESVVKGRKSEYPQHDWDHGLLPTDPEVFEQSKIGSHQAGDRSMRQWYQSLIQARRQWQRSGLISDTNLSARCDLDAGIYRVDYRANHQRVTVVARIVPQAHASLEPVEVEIRGELVLDSRPGVGAIHALLPNHAKVFFERDANSNVDARPNASQATDLIGPTAASG